jgi:hypothetical protein
MATDIERIEARQRRRETHPSHDCPDRQAVGADIQFLIDELTAARQAVARLTEDDADLRASAEIWCRLYEAALERASAAEAAIARSPDLPGPVQALYDALDRVADLTNALGAVVRECAVCARASEGSMISQVASEACARCSRALEALARRAH